MPTDSTRNNIVEKILGLHYNDFQNSAPCIDSAFTSIGSQKSPIIGSSWESRVSAAAPGRSARAPAGSYRGHFALRDRPVLVICLSLLRVRIAAPAGLPDA